MNKIHRVAAALFAVLGIAICTVQAALAEDSPEELAGQQLQQQQSAAILQAELDAQLAQVRSELRAQRDLAELRLGMLENQISASSLYVERILFAFVVAGAIVTFVVLTTMNKQTGLNNEKMRNLIRESERALGDLHRMLDRPEAEHFHVSRKLAGVMNKMRQNTQAHLSQKEMRDIYASADDPTLPVALHLQANALKQEQSGDFRGAVQFWDKLLAIDSSNPEIYLRLAQNFKQLAETSNDGQSNNYRKASLDFFHEYAVRTNQHMQAEEEVRRHLQLDQGQRVKSQLDIQSSTGSAPSGQPVARLAPLKAVIKSTSSTARAGLASLQQSTVQKVAKLSTARNEDKRQEPQAFSAPMAQQQNDSPNPPKAAPASGVAADAAVIQAKANGAGIDAQQPAAALPKPEVVIKRAPSAKKLKKTAAKAKSAKPVKVKKIHAPVAKAKLEADKAQAEPDKHLDPAEIKLAYKSRMSKANECFMRYMEAKPKEKRAWLEAALSEFAVAETYLQEEKLYRLWGIALLEVVKSQWGGDDLIKEAASKFAAGIAISDGALNNELALCHALNHDEQACRQALEEASKLGKLNPEIYMEQPEFEIYRAKDWFKQLSAQPA